jgi:hypothetical protein
MCILQRTSTELVEPVIAIQLRPRAQHPFRSYSTIHLLKPEKCHEDAVFHLLKDDKYVDIDIDVLFLRQHDQITKKSYELFEI